MNFHFFYVLLTLSVINLLLGEVDNSKSLLKQNSRAVSDPSLCLQPAKCTPIQNATCFGTVLPYSFTSLALADDSISQQDIQENLALWKGLQSVPRCWAVVQPLLCAVYMPKCENGSLFLPSQEMCRITRGPCRAVEVKHEWPPYLRCENKKLFPRGCQNPLQQVKFNTSAHCVAPLVETYNSDNWYDGVEGCGIQCQNPFYTKEEHENVHRFVGVMASLCFIATSFAVVTFLITWKAASHYPNIIIFCINICTSLASVGWLIQFIPGAREDIACLHDGSARTRHPRSLYCIITLVLTYSFPMLAIVWFVFLPYLWLTRFSSSGTPHGKRKSYFHIAALTVSIVLTTTALGSSQVDGDSLTGICFVGHSSFQIRVYLLLIPLAVASLCGGIFLIKALYRLLKLKRDSSQDGTNINAKGIIRNMICRIGIFGVCALIFVVCTFACHAYTFFYKEEWEESLREYIVCQASSSAASHEGGSQDIQCSLKNKPSASLVYLQLTSFFGFGILMSSWVWTGSTFKTWRNIIKSSGKNPDSDPSAMKKHKLIAEAYHRRKEINQGHLSFGQNGALDDPVGMNLEVNSAASQEISSSWAAALPQFLTRRGAMAVASPFALRHYSSASDISRRISLDSYSGHQQNLDSLSLQMSEKEFVARALRHQRRKTRKERERFLKANRIAPWFPGSRRGSDSSIESSIIAASVASAAARKSAAVLGSKVTKATSTGDLPVEMLPRAPSSFVVTRPLVQRQGLAKIPFTHGMTDNSHCLNSSKRPPTENTCLNNNLNSSPGVSGVNPVNPQTPFNPMNALYSQSLMQQMQYGYLGGMMYPPAAAVGGGFFPGFLPGAADCRPYGGLPYLPCGPYAAANSLMHQYQSNLPSHATIDSASETEYLPIILSDSDFTDAGHMSYDEAQLLSPNRLLQEQSHQIASQMYQQLSEQHMASVVASPIAKMNSATSLHSQSGNLLGVGQHVPSGKRSPYSEAPPPSPAESIRSCNRGGGPKVQSPNAEMLRNVNSSCSLPHSAQLIYESPSMKFPVKRTASLSPMQLIRASEQIEMTENPLHNFLGLPARSGSQQFGRNNDLSAACNQNSNSVGCAGHSEKQKCTLSADVAEHVSR